MKILGKEGYFPPKSKGFGSTKNIVKTLALERELVSQEDIDERLSIPNQGFDRFLALGFACR